MNQNQCDKIHIKNFFMGLVIFPVNLLVHLMASMIFIIIGTVYHTILIMKGEPTDKYNLIFDHLKDKKLRYKKQSQK